MTGNLVIVSSIVPIVSSVLIFCICHVLITLILLLCCVKSVNCCNFLFQASDEKIAMEMNLIRETDIKVDSEKFCDANDDQANYDGARWIIIC